MDGAGLAEHFANPIEPRVERTRRHELVATSGKRVRGSRDAALGKSAMHM
jgi:hypothetical protein